MSTTAPAVAPLAPGFRFHPTDEELVIYYLKRKILNRPLLVDAIAEVDLYKTEPWDLPGLSRIQSRDLEWYFFSPLDRKYENRSRTNRATEKGYWKTTGKDRAVSSNGGRVVGMKKTLVFHVGRAPKGERTNWVMHEYRLEDAKLAEMGVHQDGYVVCRIFQKSAAGPQNGAKYGAPCIENEWDEEEEASGLEMLPVGVENEVNEAADDEFSQFDEFVRNQEIRNQDQVSNVQLAGSDRQDGSKNQSTRAITLDEELEDPKFIDEMVDYISNTGPEAGSSVLAEETENKFANDLQSQSPLSRPDEYLEINDLINIANVKCSDEESDNYPLRASFTGRWINGEGEGSSHVFSSDDNFNCNRNENLDESDLFRMPAEDNLYFQPNGSLNTHSWPLWNEGEQDLAFYDVPNEFSFTHESLFQLNEQNPPISQPSSLTTIDDFMVYFDATDNMIHCDTTSQLESIVHVSDQTEFGNMVDDLSSEKKVVSYANTKGASSSVTHEQHDVPSNHTTKTSTKHMINMLGSISAPSAFASESPPMKGKNVEHGMPTSGSIHVTAGVIEIHGSMAGMVDNWFDPRSSKIEFLISCSMADTLVGKPFRSEPINKDHAGVINIMLGGGGFYLFLLSAVLLAVSYKMGMLIYSR